LIGATTENPSFTINNALISRCRVFVFEALKEDEIAGFIKKNLERIKKNHPDIVISDENILLISKL